MVARRADDGYRFDVLLQGDGATGFFDFDRSATEEDDITALTTPPFRADHVGSLPGRRTCRRARITQRAASTPPSSVGSRTTRSGRSCASRRRSGCVRRPTVLRRASWHMDFIYQLDGITARPATSPSPSTTSRATSSSRRRRSMSTASSASRGRSSATTRFPQEAVTANLPKLTIPSPSISSLPRRQGGGRSDGLPHPRRVLGRPDRRLPRRGTQARRARLHLPPVRRHQPRLHERPAPA